MSKGYLYILVNPSMPENFLFIGKSDRPSKRADKNNLPKDVPYVAYDVNVSDCDKAQTVVHNEMKKFRQKEHPDFFKLPLEQAIHMLRDISEHLDKADYYQKAIELDPNNPSFYNNLGCSYDRLGNHTAAINAYKKAIELDLDNEVFYNNLGCSYGKLGLYRKSIDAFKKALKIQPDFVKAYFDLGFSYGQIGFHKEAVAAFKEVIRINPNIAQVYYNISHSYSKLNALQKAVHALKQAVRINPNYVSAHYNLGMNYLKLDDKKAALKQYKVLRDIDEDKARHLFNKIYRRYRKKKS